MYEYEYWPCRKEIEERIHVNSPVQQWYDVTIPMSLYFFKAGLPREVHVEECRMV